MNIKHPLLSPIVNSLDFPIRLGYSQITPLSNIYKRLSFWKVYASNFDRLDKLFEEAKQIWDDHEVKIKNKTILELGPGNSYINAYNFLMLGAKQIILVDKYPRYSDSSAQQDFLKAEREFIERKYKKKVWFLDNNNRPKSEYIKLIPKDLTHIQEPLRVDLLYSKSVLEHIKDIEQNIHKMSQVLTSGGFMYHWIDMRDHYNFANPYLFYKYDCSTWDNLLTREGTTYTNRWRYHQFKKTFEQSGLTIVWENKNVIPLASETKLAKPFNTMPRNSLQTAILKVLLQKK